MTRFVLQLSALSLVLLLIGAPSWGDDDAPKGDDDPKTAKVDAAKDDAPADDDANKADDAKADDPKPDDQPPKDDADPKDPADPKDGDDPEDGDEPKEPEVDPVEEWDRLSERKKEIAAELAELKTKYEAADRVDRPKIREEFGELVDEYTLEIADAMQDHAAKVLAARPDDAEAAAMLTRTAYDENDYARVLELAAVVEKAGPSAGYEFRGVRRLAARAHFALHEFDEALAILEEVDDDGARFEYFGLEKENLEPAATEYVDLWAEEQEIRAKEDALEGEERLPLAVLEIENAKGEAKGTVELLLFSNEAPNTVASFVKTVKDGEYDGVEFHRVIPNFVAQGGRLDPPVEWTIDCECYEENARLHFRGSLSMALSGKDTGSTQFFITVLPTHTLNPESVEGVPVRGHTVFGRVVKGMDVVDAVEKDDVIKSATMAEGRLEPGDPTREGEEEPETTDTPEDDEKPEAGDDPKDDGEKDDGEKDDDETKSDSDDSDE